MRPVGVSLEERFLEVTQADLAEGDRDGLAEEQDDLADEEVQVS
jgi:hypothetical protein